MNPINSYTSWQPLEEVIVGRAYTPDYFDFIENPQVRNQLQQILYETEEDLINLLQMVNPDIRFIGEDYRGQIFTGSSLPIKVTYTARRHNFSTSALRKRIKNA
jgi:hypothetical protein